MKRLIAALGLMVFLVVGIGAFAEAPNGEGAIVFNHDFCFVLTPFGQYEGHGNEVLTPSGNWKFTCNAKLVDGPGLDKKAMKYEPIMCGGMVGFGEGKIIESPGGTALGVCHTKF